MKDELRQKLKRERAEFTGAVRAQADLAILNGFLSAFGKYQSFFIYNGFSSEADTAGIIGELSKAGKTVYLPRVEGENIVPVPYGKTTAGAYGIYEPTGQAFAGDIDITVVPLLAVNGRGHRVGYGKGYYDRYLKCAKTVSVGLGYAFQIREFNESAHDIPLDFFICEKGITDFGKQGILRGQLTENEGYKR